MKIKRILMPLISLGLLILVLCSKMPSDFMSAFFVPVAAYTVFLMTLFFNKEI